MKANFYLSRGLPEVGQVLVTPYYRFGESVHYRVVSINSEVQDSRLPGMAYVTGEVVPFRVPEYGWRNYVYGSLSFHWSLENGP